MAKLIALDDGHGMQTAGKRTPAIPELGGRVIHENEFNRAVVNFLDQELKRCGFNTLSVAPTDDDTSMKTRTDLANAKGADAYISIHYNDYDSKFDSYDPEGLEIHVYPGSNESKMLAECVMKYLKEGTIQKNRGIKESTFQVLRDSKMPAILTENGFMDNKREAMLMINVDFQKEVAREHAKGICDYFGVKYIEESKAPVVDPGTPIMGKSECTASQLEAFLLKNNPSPKINASVSEFCKLWIVEAEIEGVRGDIAYCQACHETAFFKYGGLVLPEQNNFGGIGATNNSSTGEGAWFDTPQIGVRASIQHLKAYGSKEPLKQVCVDPRFNLVTRGVAPNFEDLGGKWAIPGYDKTKYTSLEAAKASKDTYGHYILNLYNQLKQVKVEAVPANLSSWAKAGYDFVTKYKISDGTRPKDQVTREEVWAMLKQFADSFPFK